MENTHRQAFLVNTLTYPLQLQIGFHEIHANMWVRNGMQMKGQAMTYVQNHFFSSFSDADLFLVQSCAAQLDSSLFMNLFFERFHLTSWLKRTIKSYHKSDPKTPKPITQEADNLVIISNIVEEMLDEFNNSQNDPNSSTNLLSEDAMSLMAVANDQYIQDQLEPPHQTAMLLGALTILAQILMVKPNLRLKSYLLTRREIVYILSASDRTYSQIEESLPDICSLSSSKRFIQSILNEVSDYLQPSLDLSSIGSLKQGRYKLKDEIWLNEYDPLFVMLRSVKRREFQESFDRYLVFVEKKTSGRMKSKKNLWPPFKLPNSVAYTYGFVGECKREGLIENEEYDLMKEYENDVRLDAELNARWNLLNTKVLHAVIITLLYEVN
jgi:hypothetical protein